MATDDSSDPRSAAAVWLLGRTLSRIHSDSKKVSSLRYVEWMLQPVVASLRIFVGRDEPSTWRALSKILRTTVRSREDALAALTLDLTCLWRACSDTKTGQDLLDSALLRIHDALDNWVVRHTTQQPPSNEIGRPLACSSTSSAVRPADLSTTNRSLTRPITMYSMALTCPVTSASWVVRRRFSHFHALHQELEQAHSRHRLHPEIAWMLRMVLTVPWPRKHWLISKSVVHERTVGFGRLFARLLCVLWLCGRFRREASTHDALDSVEALLLHFLDVPPGVSVALLNSTVLRDDCSICLTAVFVGTPDATTLACGHSFHAECISTWIDNAAAATCPICRRSVTDHPNRRWGRRNSR